MLKKNDNKWLRKKNRIPEKTRLITKRAIGDFITSGVREVKQRQNQQTNESSN